MTSPVTAFVLSGNKIMAGTISALQIQKRNKERVNVFVDEKYTFAVTVNVALGLRKGQYLSDADIEQLIAGDERDKAYHHAVHFLGFRPRSQAEVSQRLREKGYSAEVIEHTVQRLVEQKYLNDEEFARYWLENREQFKPRGARALRYELRQKGIDDQTIEAVLGDLDEDASAWTAVQQRLRQWQHLPEEQLKKKVMGFLSRRGFGYSVVDQVWQKIQNGLTSATQEVDWE